MKTLLFQFQIYKLIFDIDMLWHEEPHRATIKMKLNMEDQMWVPVHRTHMNPIINQISEAEIRSPFETVQ